MGLINEVRAKLGKEAVYIYDPFEDLMVRNGPEDGWFVKRRGSEEFKAGAGSGLVADAMRQLTQENIVTAELYAEFT